MASAKKCEHAKADKSKQKLRLRSCRLRRAATKAELQVAATVLVHGARAAIREVRGDLVPGAGMVCLLAGLDAVDVVGRGTATQPLST